jgi:hypothetical protein
MKLKDDEEVLNFDDPSQSPYGFAECLEILNAIIGGFMMPLDIDHRTHIFEQCLLPLHRS